MAFEKALYLTVEIDKLTKSFPKDELYILTSQIKRAADSVIVNIADGCTGRSNAVFKVFLNYSIRSGIGVVSSIFVGKRRAILDEENFQKLYEEYQTLIKMVTSLRNTL